MMKNHKLNDKEMAVHFLKVVASEVEIIGERAGMMAQTLNLGTGEAKLSKFLRVSVQPSLRREFQNSKNFMVSPYLKITKEK